MNIKPHTVAVGASILADLLFTNIILYVFIYTICLCKQGGPIYSILERARSNIIGNPEIDRHWSPVLH